MLIYAEPFIWNSIPNNVFMKYGQVQQLCMCRLYELCLIGKNHRLINGYYNMSPTRLIMLSICASTFIQSNSSFSCFDISNTIFTLYNVTRCADDKPYVPTYQVSKEKAKSLGIEFTPLEVSLKETVESLKEKKFSNL